MISIEELQTAIYDVFLILNLKTCVFTHVFSSASTI